MPIYRPIEGLPQRTHEGLLRQALEQADAACPETLPEAVRERYGLLPYAEALRRLHRPATIAEAADGQRRISFEQLLLYQLAVRSLRDSRRAGFAMAFDKNAVDAYWRSLTFAPTGAQKRVLDEIARDLRGPEAMARMVQGDVGCGKTAVAFGAMELCVRAGYQAALMAPTELLARQHYEDMRDFLAAKGISCGLFLGGMKAKERREALAAIESGAWRVIIGTHALIGESVVYENLGLCVTDEQHRFGVGQRTRLLRKGERNARAPHLLVLSATPIPRSLALILYGDLALSVIDELPPGRKPVTTRIVPEAKRAAMYEFVRKELQRGRQAYTARPPLEADEADGEPTSAESHAELLRAGPFQGMSVGLTYGRQPSEEKAATLRAFSSGETSALVATTVVEVGVNVPNATVMVVENADGYGLAQLHQLRGRVGRGDEQSWCFLVGKPNERLRALTATNDGFEIARKDMELRGPGELLGTRQSGVAALPGGLSVLGDAALLRDTSECAQWLADDPALMETATELRQRAQAYLDQRLRDVSVS